MEIFWVPFAFSFAVPARWGFRICVAVGLAGAALMFLSPKSPWQDRGSFDGIGVAIAVFFFSAIIGGGTVRLFAELLYARPILCRNNPLLRRADQFLAVATGGLAGIAATLLLAVSLRGQTGGLLLHVAIGAAIGSLALLFALFTRGLPRLVLASATLTVAVLILWGGISYPNLINHQAAMILPDAPRCIRTGNRAPTTDELRLLTLPKAQLLQPGLILTVMVPGGPRHFRWSYRSMRFRTYESYPHGACPPAPALP